MAAFLQITDSEGSSDDEVQCPVVPEGTLFRLNGLVCRVVSFFSRGPRSLYLYTVHDDPFVRLYVTTPAVLHAALAPPRRPPFLLPRTVSLDLPVAPPPPPHPFFYRNTPTANAIPAPPRTIPVPPLPQRPQRPPPPQPPFVVDQTRTRTQTHQQRQQHTHHPKHQQQQHQQQDLEATTCLLHFAKTTITDYEEEAAKIMSTIASVSSNNEKQQRGQPHSDDDDDQPTRHLLLPKERPERRQPVRAAAMKRRRLQDCGDCDNGDCDEGEDDHRDDDDLDDEDSSFEARSSPRKSPANFGRAPCNARFPKKLREMVTNPRYREVIRWSPEKTSIVVTDVDRFATEIFPIFFTVQGLVDTVKSRLKSFRRQLAYYGTSLSSAAHPPSLLVARRLPVAPNERTNRLPHAQAEPPRRQGEEPRVPQPRPDRDVARPFPSPPTLRPGEPIVTN